MSENIKVQLCRPDKTIIYNMTDIINPVYTQIYGGINTFDFEIPYYVTDYTGTQVKNELIDIVQQFYLILFNDAEYFVIDFPTMISNEEKDVMQVKSYGLAYQLAFKRIRNFQTGTIERPVAILSTTIDYILQDKTDWTVDLSSIGNYIKEDGSQESLNSPNLVRMMDISDATVLEAINQVCEKWDCVPIFNSLTKTIGFVDYKVDGSFLGLVISPGRYLKNIQMDKVNDLVTKLNVFGVNDVSIQSLTTTGEGFLTDYTAVKNTTYMSQDMIDRLDTYELFLATKDGEFSALLIDRNAYNVSLAAAYSALDLLNNNDDVAKFGLTELNNFVDLATVNTKVTTGCTEIGMPIPDINGDWTLAQAKSAVIIRTAEINTYTTTVINPLVANIDAIDDSINVLRVVIQEEKVLILTAQDLEVLQSLTFESTFVDSTITSMGETTAILEKLLIEAKKQLALVSTSRFSATLDVIDFYSCVDTDFDKDKLRLGDIIKVNQPNIDLKIDAKIIEIEQNFDSFSLKLKIANEKDLRSGFTKSQELLKNVSTISGTISVNSNNWTSGGDARTIIDDYMDSAINTTNQMINAGVGNSVQINERGITITDPEDPEYVQRFTAGAWGLSSDGGATYKIGASKGTIYADTIIGNLIIGQAGIFEGISIFDGADEVCRIGDFISENPDTLGDTINGIQIHDGYLEIIGATPVVSGVQFDTSYGGVYINATTGIKTEATTGTKRIKTVMNSTEGFYIAKSTDSGTTYNNVFSVDASGNAIFKGSITGATGTFTGSITGSSGTFGGIVNASDYQIGGNSIISNGAIQGSYIDNINAGTITSGTIIGIVIKTGLDSVDRIEMSANDLQSYNSSHQKDGPSFYNNGTIKAVSIWSGDSQMGDFWYGNYGDPDDTENKVRLGSNFGPLKIYAKGSSGIKQNMSINAATLYLEVDAISGLTAQFG